MQRCCICLFVANTNFLNKSGYEKTGTLKRNLQNIAFALLAIFSFPLAYQPFHVAVHHSHAHCSQCTVSCSTSNTDLQIISVEATPEKEEPCPICNYHFPLNDVPSETVSLKNIEIETELINVDLQKVYINIPDSNIKSRAPPAA